MVYAPTVFIENRVGAESLRRSAADGSLILQTPGSVLTPYPHIYKSVPYDPVRDFKSITTACTLDFALVVSTAATSVKQSASMSIGARPIRPMQHMAHQRQVPRLISWGLMLGHAAGIKMLHIGYKGAASALHDLMGGQIPAYVGTLADVVPHLGRAEGCECLRPRGAVARRQYRRAHSARSWIQRFGGSGMVWPAPSDADSGGDGLGVEPGAAKGAS